MHLDHKSEIPIYLQIAREIEDAIFIGAFEEETQIPSTTEISMSLKINPATVLKGINILVDEGIIYKKRGLGTFVCEGASTTIKEKRQKEFYQNYIKPLISEAKKLDLQLPEMMQLLERGFKE